MNTLPKRIGDGGQFMLQAVQFQCEIALVSQRHLPVILFVEVVRIGLSSDLDKFSGTLRLIASVVMVRQIVLGQASTPRPIESGA